MAMEATLFVDLRKVVSFASRLAPLVFVWPLGLGANELGNRRPPLPLPLPAVFLLVKNTPLVFPEPARGLPFSPMSC